MKCSVYDAPCLSPLKCSAADACCAGDTSPELRSNWFGVTDQKPLKWALKHKPKFVTEEGKAGFLIHPDDAHLFFDSCELDDCGCDRRATAAIAADDEAAK